MKSKTSCFNRMIFQKNIALFWPLWVTFTVFMFLFLPIALQLNLNLIRIGVSEEMTQELLAEFRLRNLQEILNTKIYLILIVGYALVYAMAMFSYLLQTKSANMIHSLPVTRKELFVTNYISGLTMMVIPEILTFIFTVLVCINNGVAKVQYIGVWLCIAIGTSILFYSMGVFCCFLTGLLFVVPFLYVILNFFFPCFRLFAGILLAHNGYGLSVDNIYEALDYPLACPAVCLYNNMNFQGVYGADGQIVGLYFSGVWKYLLIYLAVAVVFTVIAYIMYQKRALECAQDMLAFGFLKPIFRWGIGIAMGWIGSIAVISLLVDSKVYINRLVQGMLIVVFSLTAFFVAEMLIQKGFRVFTKKRMKECGIFLVISALGIVAVRLGTGYMENRMPSKEDVKRASLAVNGSLIYDENDLGELMDMQRDILAKRNQFRYYDNLLKYENGGNHVNISYYLKNGEHVYRSFNVPDGDESKEIFETIDKKLADPKAYMRAFLDFENGTIVDYSDAYFDKIDMLDDDWNWQRKQLTAEDCKALYKAVEMEAQEGRFQKYNGWNVYRGQEKEDGSISADTYIQKIYLNFIVEFPLDTRDGYSGGIISENYGNNSYYSENQVEISLGTDSSYIIQTLLDREIIHSADELITEEDFEKLQK